MHTLETADKSIFRAYPSCLDELSPDQAAYFVFLYIQYLQKELYLDKFKELLAIKLLEIKPTRRYFEKIRLKKPKEKDENWLENVHSNMLLISDSLNSFFTYEEETDLDSENTKQVTEKLNFDCIKNLIPEINGYYGPKDGLTDCTFWEYKEAHNAFVEFANTMDENCLLRLAAILYRKKKSCLWLRKWLPGYDGNIRRRFVQKSNPLSLESRMKRMRKATYSQLYFIFLFFKSCEMYLRYGSPVVDGKEINLSVLYEGSGSSSGEDIGLTGILFTMAETSVFGDIEKTSDAGLYDILVRLYQVTIQYKNLNTKDDTNS